MDGAAYSSRSKAMLSQKILLDCDCDDREQNTHNAFAHVPVLIADFGLFQNTLAPMNAEAHDAACKWSE